MRYSPRKEQIDSHALAAFFPRWNLLKNARCQICAVFVAIFDSTERNTLDDYVGRFVKLYVISSSYTSTTRNYKRTGKSV